MQQDIHSVHNGQPATPGEHKPSVLLGVNRNHSSSASQLAQSNDPTFAPHFRDYIMSLASEALTGFQKGQAYDQNRPSYPPQVVDKLLQALHIKGVAGAEVLDLAAGTGKFTELLAKRDEQFQITAVEPHQDMRFELEKKHLSNVKVLNGLATKIPLPDEGVDAVIIAQAFHWFATQDALKELHRVIRLSGVLGMVWNIEDYNQTQQATKTTKWEAKLNDFIWTFKDNTPRFRNSQWKGIFDNQIKSTPLTITAFASPLFSLPLGEDEVKWTVWLTKEKIWDRFSTLSQIAILEGEALEIRVSTAVPRRGRPFIAKVPTAQVDDIDVDMGLALLDNKMVKNGAMSTLKPKSAIMVGPERRGRPTGSLAVTPRMFNLD